jgi:threonylcarbamoyladenosine tRNA methylthiotransferase MtaB
MNNGKVCPYLHLPIQSGSNTILHAMSRRYSVEEYKDFVLLAKSKVQNLCIGTDVIVGFPGESKENFDETVLQLMTLPIDYFHVFSYSERKFARSKKLNPVDPAIIKERSKILRELSKKKRLHFYSQFLNTTQIVLIETEKQGWFYGITKHFVRVKFKNVLINEKKQGFSRLNTFVKVQLIQNSENCMVGILEGEEL